MEKYKITKVSDRDSVFLVDTVSGKEKSTKDILNSLSNPMALYRIFNVEQKLPSPEKTLRSLNEATLNLVKSMRLRTMRLFDEEASHIIQSLKEDKDQRQTYISHALRILKAKTIKPLSDTEKNIIQKSPETKLLESIFGAEKEEKKSDDEDESSSFLRMLIE